MDIFKELRSRSMSSVHDDIIDQYPELYETWHEQIKDERTSLTGRYNREFGVGKRYGKGSARTPEDARYEILTMIRGAESCYCTARHYIAEFLDLNGMSLDRVFIDMDSSEQPGKALLEAGQLYDDLLPFFDEIKIRFSGSKGCHLVIDGLEPKVPFDSELRKKVLREFVVKHIDPLELLTHDRKVTVDLNRLQRIVNTRHPKTGLWCIPISREEIDLGIDEIKRMAREPRLDFSEGGISKNLSETLETVMEEVRAKEVLENRVRAHLKEAGKGKHFVDARGSKYLSGNHDYMPGEHCPGVMMALKGVGEGSRSLAALGLKKFWERLGIFTPAKLEAWNRLNSPVLDEEALGKVLLRQPSDSFCFFLNSAELCPQGCPHLIKK